MQPKANEVSITQLQYVKDEACLALVQMSQVGETFTSQRFSAMLNEVCPACTNFGTCLIPGVNHNLADAFSKAYESALKYSSRSASEHRKFLDHAGS